MHITQQNAQNIVDEMKSVIHHDINIMDQTGVIIASTNITRQGRLHQGALRVIREDLPSLFIWDDNFKDGVQRGINLPITINGQLEGVIGITGNPEEVAVFGDIIKRMTEIMLETAHQREERNLMQQAKSLFIENWLFSHMPDWAELEVRGQLLNIDINAPYTVAILSIENQKISKDLKKEDLSELRSNLVLSMVQNNLKDNSNHFCAVIHNKIMVLLCQVDRDEAFSKIKNICGAIEGFYDIQVSAGISNCSKCPSEIRHCYLEAKTAAAVAAQSAKRNVVFYNQVSLEFITQSIPFTIKKDLRNLTFASCTLQEQKEFEETIRLYFDQDGDIKKCAEKLFIHRNTFQYRIDNIKKKIGYDMRRPKDSLLLYLIIQESTSET